MVGSGKEKYVNIQALGGIQSCDPNMLKECATAQSILTSIPLESGSKKQLFV